MIKRQIEKSVKNARLKIEQINKRAFLTISAVIILFLVGIFYLPLIPIALLVSLWITRNYIRSQPEKYPLKTPKFCKKLDPNQLNPVTGKPILGTGTMYLGSEAGNPDSEIWLTESDVRQHFLMLGGDDTDQRDALIGMAANSLSWNSGFLFIDGSGSAETYAHIHRLCKEYNREQDLLVLNFLNLSNNTAHGIHSMRLNPFKRGSADSLSQLVVSLMDDVGGDGAMWKGRATAMLIGVMRALCWLRDNGYLNLNVSIIRDHMSLKRIIKLADENEYPDLPENIRKSIRSYLTSLPGYSQEKKERQAQTTLDQHGYLEMQFTKILGSLADVYGHIFGGWGGNHEDIDLNDVVLNRRILVVLLPALEKSGDEVANLGKIIVATLKGMMGAALGSNLTGNWDEIVENKPTTGKSPFMVICKDVGYYLVEGMALMSAQARSLGFSMVYAAQDIPAMKRLNEKEAASIIANTNTKIFLRTDDSTANQTVKESETRNEQDNVTTYYRTKGNSNKSTRSLTPGTAKIIWQDKVITTNMFMPYRDTERSNQTVDINELISLNFNKENSVQTQQIDRANDTDVKIIKNNDMAIARLNEKEAASIIAATNTKIFMRTEENIDDILDFEFDDEKETK